MRRVIQEKEVRITLPGQKSTLTCRQHTALAPPFQCSYDHFGYVFSVLCRHAPKAFLQICGLMFIHLWTD